jgi:hypothetical protein
MSKSEQCFVGVSPKYFQKAKQDYRDWRFAFFRELMQNLEDAGATLAEFLIEETENGCRITIKDNGHGMTQAILLTKFMALRESTKDGSDAIGGFGIAKEVIAFCHNSYRIETCGVVLEGAGGVYQHWPEPTGDGVKFIIEMDEDAYAMRRTLKHWCSLSNQRAVVTLDGEKVEGANIQFKHRMTVPFGVISFKDSNDSSMDRSTLIVKMQGLAMFVRHIYTDGGSFIADLDLKGSSVDPLLSSRDGLTGDLESTLTEILNQLANNRGRLKLSNPVTYELNPDHYDHIEPPEALPEVAKQHEAARSSSLYTGSEVKALADSVSDMKEFQRKSAELAETLSRAMLKKEYKNHDKAIDKVEIAIDQVDADKLPKNWIIRVGASDNGSAEKQIKRLTLKKYARIAHSWQIVVNYILTTNERFNAKVDRKGNVHVWGKIVKCGFVLDDVRALCVKEEDAYQILVNPFKNEERFRQDFTTLVEYAAHECSHIEGEGHGEYFVNVMQDVMEDTRRFMRNDARLQGYGINRLENMVNDTIKYQW